MKRFAPLLVLLGSFAWSSSVGGLRFLPIYETLIVKAPKNSPPHIAFEEMALNKNQSSEWTSVSQKPPVQLGSVQGSTPLYSQKVVLAEMVIQKTVEPISIADGRALPIQDIKAQAEDYTWVEKLPAAQAARLQEAQRRSEVLSQDWSVPTWSDMARETLEKSGALAEATSTRSQITVAGAGGKRSLPQPSFGIAESVRAGSSSGAAAESDYSNGSFESSERSLVEENSSGNKLVKGPITITGGLAVTNEHHIEIRRRDEGVLKELGRVDLQTGNYFIDVSDLSGSILARLVDKEGKILGEGQFRLSRLTGPNAGREVEGFPLRVEPQPSFSGVLTSAYNSNPVDAAPPKTAVTLVKGASDLKVKRDGVVTMDQVAKGSTSIMRTAAPGYLQTASLVVAGEEFKTQLFPESMIKALEDIVAQQKQLAFDGEPTVIWGRVSLEDKPQAGIQVEIESDQSVEPVYFNSFMIPDPSLQATSENGLYAFVAVQPGFHSVLAKKGEAIFGYQNVLVEDRSVAQGDIVSTKKTDALPVRVYDAFSGEPQSVTLTMQSLTEDVRVERGQGTLMLPRVNRMGLMRVMPEGNDLVPAQYSYNDRDEFVHVPLVHWTWLSAIKSFLKIEDKVDVGTIVGFVPDENFEVFLAGYDNFESRFVVYFDMQGRILQNRKGIAGGGFIIFNTPTDTHEVVVVGERSQKMSSRVIPVDANSLSVLSFRE